MSPEYVPYGYTPLKTFISVDLPAPFSPQMAWMSPSCTIRLTFSRALTPGNSLVMERISSRTGALLTTRRRAASPASWLPPDHRCGNAHVCCADEHISCPQDFTRSRWTRNGRNLGRVGAGCKRLGSHGSNAVSRPQDPSRKDQ